MKITEREIFRYVFFRNMLSNAHILEIENNARFEEGLAYYYNLKEQLKSDLSSKTKAKLADNIPVYSYSESITLKPLFVKDESENIHLLKYAAASNSGKESPVITFASDKQDYFVRMHKSDEKFKIFIFSTLQEKLENIRLTFFPTQEEIVIKDNENPSQVFLSKFPDRIDMKLN